MRRLPVAEPSLRHGHPCASAGVDGARRVLLGLLLAAPVALAGCASPPPVRTDFPAFSYDYLTKLRLNVGSIEIDDSWGETYGATQVGALSPVSPVAALRRLAADRLVAAGSTAHAVYKIEDATIAQIRARLQASFAVQLAITTPDGTRSGYAEARVVRTSTLLDDDPDALRAALYTLTRATMDDMNVELEYQVRRSLRDYLVGDDTAGTAPPPAPVQAQDLGQPGDQGATRSPSAPSALAPQDPSPLSPAPRPLSLQ